MKKNRTQRSESGLRKPVFLLSTLCLLFLSMDMMAQDLNKKVKVQFSNTPLRTALSNIEKQTGFSFSFSENNLRSYGKNVTLQLQDAPVKQVLNRIFEQSPLMYSIKGSTVLISPRPKAPTSTPTQVSSKRFSGTVIDGITGSPAVGIMIQVDEANGTGKQRKTTTTNESGQFSIMASQGETLVFTGVGFVIKKVVLKEETQLNNIVLNADRHALDDVVVTALGIKKSPRALGYALTKVDSTQLTEAVSTNWTDALSGKVAGLQLIRSGSGPAASSKIVLRGENTLTGENEALIILDGVVISKGSARRSANASDQVYATNSDNLPADYGSSINDINPQDIESVSVLKGPAAAALYGQRAANGAIIITTKSSNQKKKGHFNVRYTINGNIEQVNRTIDRQYEYGQGLDGAEHYSYGTTVDGASTSGTSSAYGPRFNGQEFYQYDPVRQTVGLKRTPWKAYDNIDEFWNTGNNLRHNLSVDGKIATTGIRINLGTEQNNWIIPNTGFQRKNIALTTNTEITKKLRLSTKINYGFRNSDNLPAAGYGNQSLMYWYMFWQPSADYNWLRNYWAGGPGSIYDSMYKFIRFPFSSFPENPFAIAYEFLNKTRRNSLTGSATLNYQATKELSLMVRGNFDWMNDKREQLRPYDAGSRLPKGSIRRQNIYSQEKSFDVMARYAKDLRNDFKLGVSLGASQLWNNYDKTDIRNDALKLPGIYTMENSLYGLTYYPDTSRYRLNSIYGIFNLSYKNYWFAEVTARQDWNSVLAHPSRTNSVGFFYPSMNTSFVLSDVVDLPSAINYAKLRASVAGVGNANTTAYLTSFSYPYATPVYSDSSLKLPSSIPNPNLKPQFTTTYEFGTEVQFFKNRLAVDLAVYFGSTSNQIFNRTVDASAGYNTEVINSGTVRNNGVEISLNAKPVARKNFEWSIMGTFSYNQNKIISMPDSTVLLRAGNIASGQIVASVGGSMGDLYGLGYRRSPDGQVVFDAATGFPRITDSIIYLGNTMPKFKFSLGNTFRFKNFSVKALFDAQVGAVAYSLTHYKMAEQGKLASTLPGRYNGIIGNGVVENHDGTYRKNDVVAYDIDQYYQNSIGSFNAEGSTFSTDFIKFRELAIAYNFKPKFVKSIGLTSASIGIYGRDLFIWSPWPIFDPEFGTLAGTDIVRGFETGQFPSTRNMGFTLSVGF